MADSVHCWLQGSWGRVRLTVIPVPMRGKRIANAEGCALRSDRRLEHEAYGWIDYWWIFRGRAPKIETA